MPRARPRNGGFLHGFKSAFYMVRGMTEQKEIWTFNLQTSVPSETPYHIRLMLSPAVIQ